MTENKEIIAVKDLNSKNIEELLRTQNSVSPLVDIYESEDEFVITAGMPGVSRNDIQVKINDNSLIIFGKIEYEKMLSRKYVLNENELGNYFRKFNISDSIDVEKIRAGYNNGQLVIHLPKNEKIKPRTIEVN